jgi:hypothetical protein
MGSVMRGTCPAGGVTLGPAIVFGYIAARYAAGRAPESIARETVATTDTHGFCRANADESESG